MFRLKVEAVIWDDVHTKVRASFSKDFTPYMTVGMVVFEDEDKVIISHEIEPHDKYLDELLDLTPIKKALIRERRVIGWIAVKDGKFVRRSTKVISSEVNSGQPGNPV